MFGPLLSELYEVPVPLSSKYASQSCASILSKCQSKSELDLEGLCLPGSGGSDIVASPIHLLLVSPAVFPCIAS